MQKAPFRGGCRSFVDMNTSTENLGELWSSLYNNKHPYMFDNCEKVIENPEISRLC